MKERTKLDVSIGGGAIFLTGTQALVRLMLMQRQRDAASGLGLRAHVSAIRDLQEGRAPRRFAA